MWTFLLYRRPKMSKVNLGILRQQKELKENSEKIEQTRSAEKKSLKVDKYMKPKGVGELFINVMNFEDVVCRRNSSYLVSENMLFFNACFFF